jgi:hypothetical protein
MLKQLITWQQVRAGDEVRTALEEAPVNIEWVAHDYDLANPGRLLVVFKGNLGIGIISSDQEVWKTGHDFALGMRQKHPFQGVEAVFEDTDLVRSYRLWQQADDKWAAVAKYIKQLGPPHDNELQWFYEEVLTKEEREAWDLWVSGGSATPDQWASVRAAHLG